MDTNRYPATELHTFCQRVLEKQGVPSHEASITADVLVYADLHGIDSHGLILLPVYVHYLRMGAYRAERTISIVHETPGTALVDGGGGLGHPVGVWAMKLAIEKASRVGTSCIAVRNSHHFAAAGYYASLALEHDMIGVALTNAGPGVLPTFGLQPQLGTNPIALAVPTDNELPFVLDMATSVKAAGKLRLLMRDSKEAPVGWMMTADGSPGRNPEDFWGGRSTGRLGGMLPLGGAGEETSGYKGFGLGLAVELLTLLAGDTPGPFMKLQPNGPEPSIAHFFEAKRIDAFRPADEVKADVDRILAHIKASPKAPGCDRIYVAGEKEFERQQDRQANGIPLHSSMVDDLNKLAQEFDIPPPKQ